MKSCVWSRVELSFQRPQGSNFLLGHLGHQMRGHSRQYCWTSKEIFILKLVTLSLLQGYLWDWRHARPTFVAVPRNSCCLELLSQTACCRMWQSSLFVLRTVYGTSNKCMEDSSSKRPAFYKEIFVFNSKFFELPRTTFSCDHV